MDTPFGLSIEERQRLQQFVVSEENGHQFSLWVFASRTFVACRNCGVARSNSSSARFRSSCKGPVKVDLRSDQPSSDG